jgi:hypothetical protein
MPLLGPDSSFCTGRVNGWSNELLEGGDGSQLKESQQTRLLGPQRPFFKVTHHRQF